MKLDSFDSLNSTFGGQAKRGIQRVSLDRSEATALGSKWVSLSNNLKMGSYFQVDSLVAVQLFVMFNRDF